jgi:phosphoribosylaminoimidazole (AIR) synthetase
VKKDSALIRDQLMCPTELYVRRFAKLRALMPVQSAFHITGSGWLNLVRDQSWVRESGLGFEIDADLANQLPAWVTTLAERSGQNVEHLATSFNMGFGFVVVLDAALARAHADALNSFELCRIGKVVNRSGLRWGAHELSEPG